MKTHERLQFVIVAYAIFAYLWLQASHPLKDIAVYLTASVEFGVVVQLLAIMQGLRMLLESISGHRILACSPEEQVIYLEIMKKRIS